MFKKVLLYTSVILLTLTGCGGGGDSSTGNTNIQKNSAYLSDSRIAGVTYKCASLTGVTDSAGKFQYSSECSTVYFSIGGVTLGSLETSQITQGNIFYPSDLLALDRSDTNSSELTNLLQFIQSLDSDGNPNNGIDISSDINGSLKDVVLDFESNTTTIEDINTTLASLGIPLLAREYAIAHYEETLRKDLNISLRTVPPAPAIYVNAIELTKDNNVSATLNGTVASKIFLNGVDTTKVFGANNSATISLNTLGDDGLFDFNITLQDENNNISDPLNIQITKDATAPNLNISDLNITENKTSLIDLNASDPLVVSYALGGTDASSFDINASTGLIVFKTSPDYESKDSYALTILVEDSIGNKATEKIIINIQPLNDETPTITSSAKTIKEETLFVMMLESSDPDKDTTQTFTYSIDGGVDSGKFTLTDEGNLTFATAPNFEAIDDNDSNALYELNVKVSDGVNESESKSIQIRVSPINDIAPVLVTSSQVSVDENFADIFVDLNHTDADIGIEQVFTYSILKSLDYASFNISPATGAISFKTAPDYETKESYSINVAVSDAKHISATKTIAISINHLNDIAPVISASDAIIDENLDQVTTISYTDADKDENQTFSLSIAGTDANSFNINSTSGVLALKSPADYEKKKSYSLCSC